MDLCEAFGVELTAERQAQLDHATQTELERLHHAIAVDRRWPDS
jgi:hypothetical protein